jgi:DNA polymerase-1
MGEKKSKKLPVVEVADDVVDPDNQGKKTLVCTGCEYEKKPRVCGTGAVGAEPVDIMFVSESPSMWSVNNGAVFYGRGGRAIRDTRTKLIQGDLKSPTPLGFKKLRTWDTYAVQCQTGEGRDDTGAINKAAVERCATYLHAAIKFKKPKVILVFGANALRATGNKFSDRFQDVRGRIFDMEIAGHRCKVLPTFSTRHLVAKTGLYNLFYNDFVRAMTLAASPEEEAQIPLEEITKDYTFPTTVEEVKSLCDEIIAHKVEGAKSADVCTLAVDTETNTTNPHRTDAKVLCVSFAWDTGKATAIPLWHDKAPWTEAEFPVVLNHVKRVLECPKPKVFHNAKFDLKFLELRHGLKVHNLGWDTMLGEHLLREDQSGAYSLKILGRSYFPSFASYADQVHELATKATPEEEELEAATVGKVRRGKIKKGTPGFEDGFEISMSQDELDRYLGIEKTKAKKFVSDAGYERVPIDILLKYAAIDTDLTRRLVRHQHIRLREENFMDAKALMHSHALPASRTLGEMEFRGTRVDRPYLEYLEAELAKVVEKKKQDLLTYWDGMGKQEEFNANSTHHIGYLLFNRGIPGPDGKRDTRVIPGVTEERTKTGQWKTDKKTLRAIVEATKCPFTKALLDYRSAHKALSGFIGEIKTLSEADGYLHTNFHLHGTSTGRLSSSNLNMQNVPEWLAGYNIKKIFIPDDPETELLFNLDWKGAEIRVFTAYSGDKQLIKALNDGLDIHSFFTQEIYGVPYDEVANHEKLKDTNKDRYQFLKKTRTNVKRVVFGILYGAKAPKIAETAGIDTDEAQGIIDRLFNRFPSIQNYINGTHAEIHKLGRVETLFHRRRRFPLAAVNGFFRGQAERRGVNMKIQSTSSDIVIGQLVEIDQHISELGGRLCLTVHDSIAGTVKKKYLQQLPEFLNYYCVKRVAEKYPWLPVDFACDIGVGPNYGETSALDVVLQQQEQNLVVSPEDAMFSEFDREAIDELREDEEERKAAEGA